jgi:hypothetical protein
VTIIQNDTVNADECGLFFSLLKDESCHGSKRSKHTITVLVCVDMDGTEEMSLPVTGKSEKPRSFKHVKSCHVHTDITTMHGSIFHD